MSKRKTPTSSSSSSSFVTRDEIFNDNSKRDTSNPEEIALRKIAQLVAQRKSNEKEMMVFFEAGDLNEEDRILLVSRLNETFDKLKKQCMSELREAGSSVEYQKVGSGNQPSGVIDLTEDVKVEKIRNDIDNNSNSSSSSSGSSSNIMQSPAARRGNKASDTNDDGDEENANHDNFHSKNPSTTTSSSWITYPSSSSHSSLNTNDEKKIPDKKNLSKKESDKNVDNSEAKISGNINKEGGVTVMRCEKLLTPFVASVLRNLDKANEKKINKKKNVKTFHLV
jgi:hypothetical protein